MSKRQTHSGNVQMSVSESSLTKDHLYFFPGIIQDFQGAPTKPHLPSPSPTDGASGSTSTADGNTESSRFEKDFICDPQILGRGAMGCVYKAKDKMDKTDYAVKCIEAGKGRGDKWILNVVNEIETLAKLDGERGIVQYRNAWKEESKEKISVYIQMELCQLDLQQVFEMEEYREKWLGNRQQKLQMLLDIFTAVEYIHEMNFMHRDLKPGNIFLSLKDCIKIGDLGLAKKLEMRSHTRGSRTFFYQSPEVMTTHYDSKTDIYSLGMITFELFLEEEHYMTEESKNNDPFTDAKLALKDKGILPKLFKEKEPEISDLIFGMIKKEPTERPSATDIVAAIKEMLATM